jgi:aquaporin NIP
MKKYYAEAIGTYMMVFCGTGAIIINQEMNGVITHPGIAATFGLIVAAVIYALGDVSGAHINPAVTIAFALRKVFPVKENYSLCLQPKYRCSFSESQLTFIISTERTVGWNISCWKHHASICIGDTINFFS